MPALVWVVDDSPLDLQRAERALSAEFEVRTFSDGSAVLEQIATSPAPDVLVLDWVMPGVSGIEVIRFMRSSRGRMASVPVLLLTMRNRPEQIAEGLDAGANDHLDKPYADEEVRARVASLVRSSQLLERAVVAEATVRTLLANAPDALLVVDAQGKVTYANSEAERALGMPVGEIIARDVNDLLPDLPIRNIAMGVGASLLPLPDLRIGDRVYSPSVRFLTTDTAAQTTIALRDVTERQAIEARRVDFYSIIAHDLRSPLNAMLFRLELMLRGRHGPLPSELVGDLRKFDGNIRKMMRMINDFLDLARMESAGYKIDRAPVNLATLVSGIVDDVRPLAEAHGLDLDWKPPPDRAFMLGDQQRLTQALSNLLGNAIKYTPPEGRIEVCVRPIEGFYEVVVRDTGPGIPAEVLPTLFDRFTRAPTESRSTQGWGLGLMIVRDIVEAHGGRVGVHSEPGKGSTFWFTVPRAGQGESCAPASAGWDAERTAPRAPTP